MMKIPKNIKNAIRKAGKYNALAVENNATVRAWLAKQEIDEESYTDYMIDALEVSEDNSLELIKFLENDCSEVD